MKLNYFLIVLLFLTTIFGCNLPEKEQPIPIRKTLEEVASSWESPELKNGKLAFENWDHVFWYQGKVAAMTSTERIAYEQSLDFISMQTAYEKFEEWSLESVENLKNGL